METFETDPHFCVRSMSLKDLNDAVFQKVHDVMPHLAVLVGLTIPTFCLHMPTLFLKDRVIHSLFSMLSRHTDVQQ